MSEFEIFKRGGRTLFITRDRFEGVLDKTVKIWFYKPRRVCVVDDDDFWYAAYSDWLMGLECMSIKECLFNFGTYPDDEFQIVKVG